MGYLAYDERLIKRVQQAIAEGRQAEELEHILEQLKDCSNDWLVLSVTPEDLISEGYDGTRTPARKALRDIADYLVTDCLMDTYLENLHKACIKFGLARLRIKRLFSLGKRAIYRGHLHLPGKRGTYYCGKRVNATIPIYEAAYDNEEGK